MPLTGLGWHGLAAALVAYGAIAAVVLGGLGQHAPHQRFGPANRLTLLRAAYTALLVGILVEGLRIGAAGRWVLVAPGAWVLTIGAMRYIFVVGGWLWPALAAPLPPSPRRKAVCVGVIIAMLVALAPPVEPMMGRWLCLGGLLLLAYSFAADCLRLAARGRGDAPAPG